ncbi:type VII secretion protein EssA [Gracilibacillus sp. D59]|uniref:type VII secretion protein EssA n=1 Tax=Gracilibacillus sp. D59 TaxID=3457434 RepID=UPI003FCE861D
MLHKPMRKIMFISCLFFLLAPLTASAEDKDESKGKMDWKIDRIIEKNSDSKQSNQETELEKRFPDLFKEETTEVISSVKKKKQDSIDQLEQDLFATNFEKNTTIEDTKQALFTQDYVAPKPVSSSEQEQESGSSSLLMTGFAGLACLVCGGMYLMFQRFSD